MARKTVGTRMREMRKSRVWSQREAAERAGMSQPMWCEYETGRRLPSHATTINRLAKILGMNPGALNAQIIRERDALEASST